MQKLIAIDPGNRTGWALSSGASGVEDLTPRKARAGKPGRPAVLSKRDGRELKPAVRAVPPLDAEPDDERLVKLRALLWRLAYGETGARFDGVLVHEGPLKHHAGVRAAQLAFWWQAALAIWCRERGVRRVEVPPIDLQRFVLGRAATRDGYEMLLAARDRLGYQGHDDNEADALHLLSWARKHLEGGA